MTNLVYKIIVRTALIMRTSWYRPVLRVLGVKMGRGVVFWGKVRIGNAPRNISVGDGCSIGHDVFLSASDSGSVRIGDGVSINTGCHIMAIRRIEIGNNVRIGEYVSIRDQDHDLRADANSHTPGYVVKGVRIGEGAWIGRGAYIGKGVNIGRGATVGANSVVTHDVEDGVTVAGAPARQIGNEAAHVDPVNVGQTAVIFRQWEPHHVVRLRETIRLIPVAGIEVSPSGARDGENAGTVASDGVRRIILIGNGDPSRLASTVVSSRMMSCLSRCRPKCVAIPGWSRVYSLAALRWCMANRVPAVCMGDSTSFDLKRSWWKERQKRRIMKCFTTAVASGTATKEYFHQLGMVEDRIFLGYNVVDNGFFQRSAECCRKSERSLRTELGLERPFFLLVARFIPEKNLFRTMDAYAEYRQRVTDPWDLVLLGDGELMPQVRQRIQELNLQECAILPGFAQYGDLSKYYALAECLVLPSQKDTWGLVVNEAMASGLPVIVSARCGCVPDLVEDTRNGFVIDPFSVDDMAEKMLLMTGLSESQRKAMGKRSQEIIADWGPERFAYGLKAAVERALAVGPKKVTVMDSLLMRTLMLRR